MKRFILGLFICLLLIGSVTAFEFDNVRTYKSKEKKVAIENAFGLGRDIRSATLKTPQVFWVKPSSSSKFAEIEFDPHENNWEDLIQVIELYNDNTQEKIQRPITYKKKVEGKWIPIEPRDKITKPTTIGLFTYVLAGDRVEWIPTFSEIGRVTEWAVFVGATRFEFWEKAPDSSAVGVTQVNYRQQNFTVGTVGDNVAFVLDGIALGLGQSNTPSNFNISIYNTSDGALDARLTINTTAGNPFGSDTGCGSGLWVNYTFPENFVLNPSETYSIVLKTTVSAPNSVDWCRNTSDSYTGGEASSSIDKGVTWTSLATADNIFEIWGHPNNTIEVNLIAPSNNTQFTSITQTLNSTAFPRSYNLTNATAYVWNSSDSIFNDTQTVTIAGNDFNETTIDVTNFDLGTFFWNMLWCGDNETGTFCDFAADNRTIERTAFANQGEYWNNLTFETDKEIIHLNITTIDTVLSVRPTLHYNATKHSALSSCNASGFCIINSTIDLPLVNGGEQENKTFFWEINVFDGTNTLSSNTSTNRQDVIRIHLEECDSTYPEQSLNFTAYNESNLSRVDPFSFKGGLNYWLGSGTVEQNTSIDAPSSSENTICLNPSNRTFFVDAEIDYNDEANGTSNTRTFYFDNASITNTSQDILLYILEKALSTTFILQVQDEKVQAVPNALINIQRFYPQNNIFRTVQVAKTDSNGKTVGFYVEETVTYKHIITSNGTVVLETDSGKIVGEVSPFTLIFRIGEAFGKAWSSFDGDPNIIVSSTFNDTSNIATYSYIDSTGATTFGRFIVSSIEHNQSNIEFCNENSSQASATLTCNLTGQLGSFEAQGFIGDDPEISSITIAFTITKIKNIFGNIGVIMGWILILVATMAGIWNPTVAIIFFNVAVILVNLIGLISFGLTYIFAMIGISIITIILMKT